MENTKKALLEVMETFEKTQTQVAKEIGLSTATISQFLDGSYKGNNKKVKNTIDKYIEQIKERNKIKNGISFYPELYNSRQTLFICNYAHLNNDIALICGAAGAGKTTALNHYKANNIGVIMVTADPCCSTTLGILKRILLALNKPIKGDKSVMFNDLIKYFKGSNKLLIIDEADNLNFTALQTIRTLNDKAKIGIVLSGNDKIYRQMLTGQKSYEFEQINSRVFVRKQVENTYNLEEIENIFNTKDKELSGILLDVAQRHCLRIAIKLYNLTIKVYGTVTLKDIRQARWEFLNY